MGDMIYRHRQCKRRLHRSHGLVVEDRTHHPLLHISGVLLSKGNDGLARDNSIWAVERGLAGALGESVSMLSLG